MKYILNETPIRTTNGFNVNNVKVDLDIPTNILYHDYNYNVCNHVNITSTIENDFSSPIGLNHDTYKNTIIDIDDDVDNTFKLEYEFKDEDNLIDNIDINVKENKRINLFINYSSTCNKESFHNGNINIFAKNSSTVNLTILNSLNVNSINMISGCIHADEKSNVKVNIIDLSGKIRIYNFKSNTKTNSNCSLNNIYIGKQNDLIDLNYNFINLEPNSNNNIEVQGLLDDKAVKTFKGIIDFKEGCKKSIGHENENCLLLSKTCISKSLPILLCHEEDVDGAHSVSSGKIDQNKMFYLMSRGIDEASSKKMIIKGNFNHIISLLPDEIKEFINTKIDEII